MPAAAAAEAPQQQQPPIAAAPGLNQQNYIPLNDPRVFPFQQFNPWQQLLRQQLQLQQQQQQQEQASAPPSSSSSSSSSSDPQSQPAPSLMDVQSFPPNFMMDNFPLNTIAGGAPQNMTMPFTLTPLVPLTSFGKKVLINSPTLKLFL